MAIKSSESPNSDSYRKLKLRKEVKTSAEHKEVLRKDEFAKKMESILTEVRGAFTAVAAHGSEYTLKDEVSEFIDEESDDRNQDLEFLILDVQFLVESILELENVSAEEKEQRLIDIENIHERMKDLSDRYQSNERGVRGAKPHPDFGYLEPDVQKVYEEILKALENTKKYLGSL